MISFDPIGSKLKFEVPIKTAKEDLASTNSTKKSIRNAKESKATLTKKEDPAIAAEETESNIIQKEDPIAVSEVDGKQPDAEVKHPELVSEVKIAQKISNVPGSDAIAVKQDDVSLSMDEGEDSDLIREIMTGSYSSLLNTSYRSIGPVEGLTKEEIELRHAVLLKREYSWSTPDWVGTPLRSTPKGEILKTKGNLASPVTDVSILLQKPDLGWEKPEWTNTKLRETANGKAIKQLAENDESIANAPVL